MVIVPWHVMNSRPSSAQMFLEDPKASGGILLRTLPGRNFAGLRVVRKPSCNRSIRNISRSLWVCLVKCWFFMFGWKGSEGVWFAGPCFLLQGSGVGFSSLPTEADAFPGGLPFSVAIDREVVKDDPEEWGLLVTYTKNGRYLMTAYRMAGLCFASHVDEQHAA